MLDLSYQSLELFQELVLHLNFSKAAKKLGYTQQALSYQIAQLEEKLGVKLFTRGSHNLKLTAEGEHLAAELPLFFSQLTAAYSELKHFDADGNSQALQLFISNTWDCDYVTGELLLSMCKFIPDYQCVVQSVDEEQLHLKLKEFPSAIGLGCQPLSQFHLNSQELFSSQIVLAAAPVWQNTAQHPPKIMFSKEQTYLFSQVIQDMYTPEIKQLSIEAEQKKYVTDTLSACKQLAIHGLGAILTHEMAILGAQINKQLVILERYSDIYCKSFISWSKNNNNTQLLNQIILLLDNIIKTRVSIEYS